jgi:hypothetical protein
MGGLSIWHWVILMAVFLIPVGIIAAVFSILRRRKK